MEGRATTRRTLLTSLRPMGRLSYTSCHRQPMPIRPHIRATARHALSWGPLAVAVALTGAPLTLAHAQQSLRVPVEYTKLSNGLKVVMSPDPTTPTTVAGTSPTVHTYP